MSIRTLAILIGAAAVTAAAYVPPADALTMRECSVKYKAAQSAGTLQGMSWKDFRKAQCGAGATMGAATTTAAPAPAAGSVKVGSAVFPTSVSPKYAQQSAGRARMHTCLDQYRANKASNANGGLKWIARGGGYYSECNKRLTSQ